MNRRTLLLTSLLPLVALLPAGCAQQAAVPPVSADHPASPAAPEAPLPPASNTLAANPDPISVQPSDKSATEGMHHHMPGMSPGMNMKEGGQ